MAELSDVLVYFCLRYPNKSELSKARLTKMVYLADWKSAIDHGRQLTDIRWQFNYYGPYVDDVIRIAKSDQRLLVTQTTNSYGEPKEVIAVQDGVSEPPLQTEDKAILDFVIDGTAPKSWSDFISLVYSTYPIITQLKFSELNLITLAQEYKEQKPQLAEP